MNRKMRRSQLKQQDKVDCLGHVGDDASTCAPAVHHQAAHGLGGLNPQPEIPYFPASKMNQSTTVHQVAAVEGSMPPSTEQWFQHDVWFRRRGILKRQDFKLQ